ncbi:unnamed protein product [Effrenium voratum]|uniref:Uncharacterized protein n=1 Tax=Effrenium voratum TaxID=2562239 RepID=A0AA36MPS3_9DINO|nr:unnamed protein product [Effrenium voratum]CAJ1418829.1 unnamed protein product [Effrenium voratum]
MEPAKSPVSYGAASGSGEAELPDLTEQLKASGIYEEYLAYRKSYFDWRKGSATGAQGELTADALEQQCILERGFEYWYPTASIFQMRFTIAYWSSVLFLLGSIFFCMNSACRMLRAHGGRPVQVWPNFFGAIAYSVACYLLYLQLINLPTRKVESLRFLCPDWGRIHDRASTASSVGTLAFLAGALLFQVSCTAALWELSPKWELTLISMPNFIGSILFVLGGVCEILINGAVDDKDNGSRVVLLASWCTFIGSCFFTAAAFFSLLVPDWPRSGLLSSLGYFLGAAAFGINAVLLLLLWEANDFGLTLFYQLNRVIEAASGSTKARLRAAASDSSKMSIRDVTFIAIYCWFIAMALIDCIIKEKWYQEGFYRSGLLLWTGLGLQIFVVATVFIVLLIHSVVLQVPSAEPFRSAMYAARAILILGTLCESIDVMAFLSGYATLDAEHLKSLLRRHGLLKQVSPNP